MTTPPRWDLSNIYLSLDDPALAADIEDVKQSIKEATHAFETEYLPLLDPASSIEALNRALNDYVEHANELELKAGKIFSFLGAIISTDSFNKAAEQLQSKMAIAMLPLHDLSVRINAWLGALGDRLEKALEIPGAAHEHAFRLLEIAKDSRYQMSEPEEILANELTLSGGGAWDELQGVLTSQKSVEFELDGKPQLLPLPALINLRSHPDADVRERAYKREQEVFEEMKEPLAACLNGVKGEVVTLDRKRGREDCLHSSLDMARIDRATLEAMLEAIDDALPMFRRYFQAKAHILGTEKLPWWSLFAPIGEVEKEYTFDEARELILEHFGSFSPELAEFASGAFEHHWIDAEQRPGKRGGAFCMGVDAVRESRIMSNFDGSFDQVMTLAHELGHMVMTPTAGVDDESAANRFAGAFLMPADVVRAEVGAQRSAISIGELVAIKERFGVSVQAIAYRCLDLGIIDRKAFSFLFKEFTKRGWRKKPFEEPARIPPEYEEPKRFERLCYRALAEGVIGESRAAEMLGITLQALDKRLAEAA